MISRSSLFYRVALYGVAFGEHKLLNFCANNTLNVCTLVPRFFLGIINIIAICLIGGYLAAAFITPLFMLAYWIDTGLYISPHALRGTNNMGLLVAFGTAIWTIIVGAGIIVAVDYMPKKFHIPYKNAIKNNIFTLWIKAKRDKVCVDIPIFGSKFDADWFVKYKPQIDKIKGWFGKRD